MNEWSKEIPQKPGLYWFIGCPWSSKKRDEKNELHLVSVRKISNGYIYVADGSFMDNKIGLWISVQLPKFPENIDIIY